MSKQYSRSMKIILNWTFLIIRYFSIQINTSRTSFPPSSDYFFLLNYVSETRKYKMISQGENPFF